MRLRIPALITLATALMLIGTGGALAEEVVQARVLFDSGNRIVLDYDLGAYESQAVDVAGVEYQEIRFESEPVVLDAGAPALPHVNRSIIIPDHARMSLQVVDAEYYEVFAKSVPSADYKDPPASMNTYVAALDDALGTFKSLGARSELPQLMYDLAREGADAGHGDDQLTALVEVMSGKRD